MKAIPVIRRAFAKARSLFWSGRSVAGAAAVPMCTAGDAPPTQAGTVVGWGSRWLPEVPAGTRFTAIAAGTGHSLALESDGTVVAWGDNSHGQVPPPTGLRHSVAIAAGWAHSLALQSDGTVVGWGTTLTDKLLRQRA